jgi:hypothetical protein
MFSPLGLPGTMYEAVLQVLVDKIVLVQILIIVQKWIRDTICSSTQYYLGSRDPVYSVRGYVRLLRYRYSVV